MILDRLSPVYARFLYPLLVLCLLLPAAAGAHKINIFAWVEGNTVHGETSFSGNGKPRNAEILVLDKADNTTLLKTRTDDQGTFSFQIPLRALREHLDLLVVVRPGEGHRGEWILPATELLAAEPDSGEGGPSGTVKVNPLIRHDSLKPTDEEMLARIVDRELEKKLAPIREMLARNSEHRTDLRDILGGIGYIIGLAGLAAWAKSRSDRKKQ
jgi:nickel transport protein